MFQLVLCLVLFLTAMFLADSVSAATSIAPSIGGTCRTKADCPLTDPASDCYCLSTQSKDGELQNFKLKLLLLKLLLCQLLKLLLLQQT